MLVGLQREQIQQRLHEQTAGRPAWHVVRERQAAGDAAINELFASPLRLAIALQVYRDRDPCELLELTGAQLHGRLWELLLATNADTYPGATAAQVRAWLAFLAAAMRSTAHQRFMLHELYLINPDPAGARRFRLIVRLAFGLLSALICGLISGWAFGVVSGLATALLGSCLTLSLACTRNGRLTAGRPITRARVGWRARAEHANGDVVPALAFVLFCGLVGALLGAYASAVGDGLVGGLAGGLSLWLFVVLLRMLSAGAELVAAEPPTRFAYERPDAVLVASRNSGLAWGQPPGCSPHYPSVWPSG